MKFSMASKKFIDHCANAKRLSGHTAKAYLYDLADAEVYFGARSQPSAINQKKLEGYLDYLRRTKLVKESTVKRRFACLKVFYKWLCSVRIVRANPFDDTNHAIRLPQRLPRALERSERAALLRVVKRIPVAHETSANLYRTAIHLLLETGLRISELLAIDCCDLSLDDQSLLVHGKGNRQRKVYIASGLLMKRLRRHLSNRRSIVTISSRLFVDRAGLEPTALTVRRELNQLVREAKISKHVTPHMLRHTCATHWLESGVDIRYVQRLLGHQSISTTEIYTHVTDIGIREALTRAFQR
jgi:site-specific recombinase XerD